MQNEKKKIAYIKINERMVYKNISVSSFICLFGIFMTCYLTLIQITFVHVRAHGPLCLCIGPVCCIQGALCALSRKFYLAPSLSSSLYFLSFSFSWTRVTRLRKFYNILEFLSQSPLLFF